MHLLAIIPQAVFVTDSIQIQLVLDQLVDHVGRCPMVRKSKLRYLFGGSIAAVVGRSVRDSCVRSVGTTQSFMEGLLMKVLEQLIRVNVSNKACHVFGLAIEE